MKGMPLPFDFEGKGVLDLELIVKNRAFFGDTGAGNCFFNGGFIEPTSVLDSAITPTRPTSSSLTLSSSLGAAGGAASTDTAGGGVAGFSDANPFATATSSNVGGIDSIPSSYLDAVSADAGVVNPAKFDWEAGGVLSDSDHSILRWVMGDVEEDPSANLNRTLQIPVPEFDFAAVDDKEGFDNAGFMLTLPAFPGNNSRRSGCDKIGFNPGSAVAFNHHPPDLDSFFAPQPKRQILLHHQEFPNELLPQKRPPQPLSQDHCDHHHHHYQQAVVVDHLYKAAELVQTGNSILAHEILARLNHHLSPVGRPFHRAAFHCKEALQQLLRNGDAPHPPPPSPFGLVFKVGAYKLFSEISPVVQFANFTANQAVLEAVDGFDAIHIVDFDIGYGVQWASLMQEIGLRGGSSTPSVKITAFISPGTHDQLELGLIRENLIHFASEVNIPFEFQAIGIDSLGSSGPWLLPESKAEDEGVAVNLPFGSLPSSMPSILSFLKRLSPRIVVSVETGCDRTDLSFADHVVHVLQSHSDLLESLDAVNLHMNNDALQKIERFLLKPAIERAVAARFRSPDKAQQHWKSLLLSCGFSPVMFSSLTESQAECVVKRSPVRGFRVEKSQSSLLLCWQKKELLSVSAWRCC